MGELRLFPLNRRHALVVETAELIERKPAEAATRFWHLTIRRLRAELQTYGLNDHDQDVELRAFANAVLARREISLDYGGDAA